MPILNEEAITINGKPAVRRTCTVEGGSYLYPGAIAHLYNGRSAEIVNVETLMAGTRITLAGGEIVWKDAVLSWTFIDDDPTAPRYIGYGEDSGDDVRQNLADWTSETAQPDGPVIDDATAREAGWGAIGHT
jgi:hypothetical protein